MLSTLMCVLVRSSKNPEPWRWSDGHSGFAGATQALLWKPDLGILSWLCILSCATGCSTSWHHRGYRHFPSRTSSNIWTCRGPYRSGGNGWQKLAQAGKEAPTSGTCATLQPPGQTGEAGWQTVQPKRPEPLHTRRLETHCSYLLLLTFYCFRIFLQGQTMMSVCLSSGWTAERVQEYFLWACDVVKGLRGTNSVLEEKLDELFKQRGVRPWLQDHTECTNIHRLCKFYK